MTPSTKEHKIEIGGSSIAFGRCSLVPNSWEVLDQT